MTTLRLSTTNARAWDEHGLDGRGVDVPEPLERSWHRARIAGVDPDRRGDPGARLHGSDLEARRTEPTLARVVAEAEAMLVAGTPELESECRLAVAAPDGVVIATFGGGEFGRRADAVGLRPGRLWCETERGTNGIGTAIADDAAVLVRSAAHVERQLHQLASVGVPVRSEHGDIVAVLGLLLPRDLAGAKPARPLRIAARAIERMLTATDGSAAWSPLPATIERVVARTDMPAMLLEPPGAVRAASPAGHALLERLRSRDRDETGRGLTVERLLGTGWAALAEGATEPGREPLPVTIGGLEDERYVAHLDPILGADRSVRAVLVLLERPAAAARTAGHLREVSVRTIVGSDAAFVEAKRTAEQFARTDLPVLLVAETGAGKEVLARAIHDSSPRATGPFVAINCGSLSPQLLESELFGYGPGAFTGARPEGHDGKIRAAQDGTLFLDEVAEMPPALQASLLRVLEDGSYYRVGETILRRADIRIICATWRDLPAMIREDRFRQDLYYRIKGACITIPPLRRRTDVSDIVAFLLDQLCFEMKLPQARFDREAMAMIRAFPWPGNIRELRSAVHHALVLGDGRRTLHPEHLPVEVREHAAESIRAAGAIPASAPETGPGHGHGHAAAAGRVPAPAPRGLRPDVSPGPPDTAAVPLSPPPPLPPRASPLAATLESAVDVTAGGPDRLEDVEGRVLRRVLAETGGNLSATARRLGVARSTLYRLLERHGLRGREPRA